MAIDNVDNLSLVLRRYQRSEQYVKPYFDRGKDSYKNFRSVKPKVVPWRNNVFVPRTSTLVDTRASNAIANVLASPPWAVVENQVGGIKDIASQAQDVLNYFLELREVNFWREFLDFVYTFYIYGRGYLSVAPNYISRPGFPVGFPLIQALDFWQVYPDPQARRELSSGRYTIIKSWYYKEDLEEMARIGVFKDVSDLSFSSMLDDDHKKLLVECGLSTEDIVIDPKTGLIETLDLYEDGNIITVAGRNKVIRDTKVDMNGQKAFPYPLPIIDASMPMPLEQFGRGIPEKIKDLQQEMNTSRSQRRDYLENLVNAPFTVDPEMIADDPSIIDNIVFASGNIIPIKPEAIRNLQVTPLSSDVYREDDLMNKDIQDESGEYEYGRGVTPERRETAAGIARLQQASRTGRFAVEVQILDRALAEVSTKVLLIMRNYMSQQNYESILGQRDLGFYGLNNDQLLQQYPIKAMGSSVSAIRETRANERKAAWELITKIPPQITQSDPSTPFVISYYDLLHGILSDLEIRDVNGILVTMQEIQAKQQRQMQQQGQQGQPNPQNVLQELMQKMDPQMRDNILKMVQSQQQQGGQPQGNPQPQMAPQ